MKKPVKLGLWLLGFALLAVLGLWLEHERAKARLAAYKAQLVAKGERLTFSELRPPPISPASNGAPDFFKIVAKLPRPSLSDSDIIAPFPMTTVGPGKAQIAWRQKRLPAQGLKDQFIEDRWPGFSAHYATQREVLFELHAALARGHFYFDDFHRGEPILPVDLTMAVSQGAGWLTAAMLHDLHYEQPEQAFQHLLAASRLVQQWDDAHLLITLLIANRNLNSASSTVWEALQYPGWTDAQLAELQSIWTSVHWLESVLRGCAGEPCFTANLYAQARQAPGRLALMGIAGWPFDESLADWWTKLENNPNETLHDNARAFVWPMWSSYGDELHSLRGEMAALTAWRASVSNYNFTAAAPWWREAARQRTNASPWHIVSAHESPFSGDPTARLAITEVVRTMTFTAIALRRHQMSHDRFPERLADLVPAFLPQVPRDFMDGQPMRYRLQSDGQFLLWSVGEDGVDDGGNAALPPVSSVPDSFINGGRRAWYYGRDIVWPAPASPEEVEKYHQSLRTKK